jgi:pseudaminic acid biosynthesis-associated methylase
MNEQESFWINQIADDYLATNADFDSELSCKAWKRIFENIDTSEIGSFLECGSNLGRNLHSLKSLLPECSQSLIEISPLAYQIAVDKYDPDNSYNGAIKESKFPIQFDLVFSMGVLIHVNPDDLLATMERMYLHSKRYILIGEYFNRTPVSISYRGSEDKLFKRDFGRLFADNFNCHLVDYGFLWGYEFDAAGFDDITYWLFEKRE